MALETDKKKLKLLKIEVPDRYVQENFKRIEKHAECVEKDLKSLEGNSGGDGGDTIINVNGAWTKDTDTVPALSSKVVDIVALANFHNLDHIFVIYNDAEAKTRRLQLTTVKEGATIRTSVYGRSGSLTNVQVSTVINSGNAEVTITNNNNYQLNVSYAKLSL